jgi:hypothetical protein
MGNDMNARTETLNEMVDKIRRGEQEEQERENGNNDSEDDNMTPPQIGKDIKPETPQGKEYVPIRNRKAYKELLRKTAKAMAFLEHVTNRRGIYNVDDEQEALSHVSKTSYRAMEFIEERKKEREQEKKQAETQTKEKDGNKKEQPRTRPKTQMSLE